MKQLLLLLLSITSFSAWGCYDRSVSETENLSNCTQLAEQGKASAQGTLGAMYYAGKGTEQDYVQAEKWFRKAAEQEYALSQQSLARMYALGHGVSKDLKESVKWYRKAAENGLPSAQGQMGVIYVTGDGVEMDTIEAYKWAVIAVANGHQQSADFRDNVAKSMSTDQIVEAVARAKAWRESRKK
ncbi:MAG: sel1 repeat family protein [Gammaproteobacteria bacterium]|nr:sel1 repeat family protein [Gammaproteobacteria bacterium]